MSESRMLGVATGESANFGSCRDQAGTKSGPGPAPSWHQVAIPRKSLSPRPIRECMGVTVRTHGTKSHRPRLAT